MRYTVDLKINLAELRITGTITSDDSVVPPPPPPPPPDPDPLPSNVVLTVTKPTAGETVFGEVGLDATCLIDGTAPQTGLLEYEIRRPDGITISEGRQSNAPWTHAWDTKSFADGAYSVRAVWLADTSTYSPWVPFILSNKPIIVPPPPPPPGTEGRTHTVTTDAELTAKLLDQTVQPGDYVRLIGRFNGPRLVRLRGLPNRRVVIGADKLGDAVIDVGSKDDPKGGLSFMDSGNYCLVKNLIITSTKPNRTNEHATGIYVAKGNQRVENCVLIGCFEGIFWGKDAVGDPANPDADTIDPPGCKFVFCYHNGAVKPGETRGSGHDIYLQGNHRTVFGAVAVGGYGMGSRIYGSGDGSWSRHSHLKGCVNVNTGVLYNGVQFGPSCISSGTKKLNNSPEDCSMDGVHQWISQHDQGGSFFGYPWGESLQNQVTVKNSVFVGGSFAFGAYNMADGLITNCDFVSDIPGNPLLVLNNEGLGSKIRVESNRFWGTAKSFRYNGQSFPIAQLPTRYPSNAIGATRPLNTVYTYRDPAGGKQALMVVYNWSKDVRVNVRLPWSGDYTIYNALHMADATGAMRTSVLTGSGSEATVDMLGQSIIQPFVAPMSPRAPCFDATGKFLHPGTEFGCFFVEMR